MGFKVRNRGGSFSVCAENLQEIWDSPMARQNLERDNRTRIRRDAIDVRKVRGMCDKADEG
jgi:hypothetical protein